LSKSIPIRRRAATAPRTSAPNKHAADATKPVAHPTCEAILRELGGRERRAGAVQRLDDLARVFSRRARRPLGAAASAKRCFSCLFL